jgi:hypothetical protein
VRAKQAGLSHCLTAPDSPHNQVTTKITDVDP